MGMPSPIPFVAIATDKPAEPAPVTLYPSRISLSTWRGCNLRCSYCVLQSDPIADDPFQARRVASVSALMSAFDASRAANPAIRRLKLTINDHSDPFLTPAIAEDSLAILRQLAARAISAPVIITTKMHPGANVIAQLASLSAQLKLSIFVSIADFSPRGDVEHIAVERRFDALRHFAQAGLHTVLYLKPIGPWTDIAALSKALARHADVINEVILSPLKDDGAGHDLIGPDYFTDYGFGGRAENAIVDAILRLKPSMKISRKRSCAINRHHALPCKPPLFGNTSTSAQAGDLFTHAISRAGYCELRPQHSLNGRPDIHLALSFMAEQLARLNIPWALIGSMATALSQDQPDALAVNDIDIAVEKKHQEKIYRWLKQEGAEPKAYLGCKGSCSRRAKALHLSPSLIDFDQYRSTLRIKVAGVAIDITSKDRRLIDTARETWLHGMKVPLAMAASV